MTSGSGRDRSSSASTSARCPAARSWSGSPTAPSSAARCTSTRTASSRTRCPAPGGGCRTTGRCRCPSDYVDVLRDAVPKAVAASGVAADDVIGIGTDFTACTVLPTLADGTPLCELPEFAGPPARVREAVEAPRRPAAGRPDQRAGPRARRAVDRPVRRASCPRSGSWPRACSCSRRTRRSTRATERWVEAADWIVWQLCGTYVRNVCTAGYKAVYQDGRLPVAGSSSPRWTSGSSTSSTTRWRSRSASSATAPAASPSRRPRWTGLRPGIAVAVGNVDAHVTSPAAQAIEPGQMLVVMGTSTCHVMNGDALARGAGHVRGRPATGSRPGLWGYEAGQSGVGDIFAWFVAHQRARRRTPSAAAADGARPARVPDRPGGAAGGRRARPGRARLAQRQPLGARRPRAVRPGRRPDPGHQAGGRLPRAARVDRVRHAEDRRVVRGERRAGATSSSSPAAC